MTFTLSTNWLLEPEADEFDYRGFDPFWLLDTHVRQVLAFILPKLQTIPEVKWRLAEHLKQNYHEGLAKLYFEHFAELPPPDFGQTEWTVEGFVSKLNLKPGWNIEEISKNYKAPNKDEIVGQWPGDEPVEELIKMLRENKKPHE
ncbi:MAG: hypothetical protein HC880_03350 [Bacteroidia bacterium]|nr:hypothetical protein [Bacteroidia bacterium]